MNSLLLERPNRTVGFQEVPCIRESDREVRTRRFLVDTMNFSDQTKKNEGLELTVKATPLSLYGNEKYSVVLAFRFVHT